MYIHFYLGNEKHSQCRFHKHEAPEKRENNKT